MHRACGALEDTVGDISNVVQAGEEPCYPKQANSPGVSDELLSCQPKAGEGFYSPEEANVRGKARQSRDLLVLVEQVQALQRKIEVSL